MSKNGKKTGKWGEDYAANFLSGHKYEILERNYRFARGEIDIVARKDGILVFVEVKTAGTKRFGEPETWVTARKQQQIGMVAGHYLQARELEDIDCRFDVIAVESDGRSYKIKHIENAFWL